MTRETLPNHRECVSFPLTWNNHKFVLRAAFFPDGRVAETFVASFKIGSEIQALSRDSTILISLALQHGCGLDTIQKALTKGEDGMPASLIGSMVDAIVDEHGKQVENDGKSDKENPS
jgi:hypothetical protein